MLQGNGGFPVTIQPASQAAAPHDNVTFSISPTNFSSQIGIQWHRNGTNISGATNLTLQLWNISTNDAATYDALLSDTNGSIGSTPATLAVVVPQTTTIAQWNFNSLTPDANVTTGATTPSAGNGSASLIGMTTATFATGDSSDLSGSASGDNSGWNISGFPDQGLNNKTAGVQFNISTAGKKSISVSWKQRTSNTGSKYVRPQYSTNGATFLDLSDAITINLPATFEPKACDLSGLPGVDNNTNFAFRIVAEFENTATGAGVTNYLPSNPIYTYGTNGTIRFDMVTFLGVPLPTPATLTSLAFTSNRFQVLLAGTTNAAYVVQSSTNLSTTNWVPVFTNFAPFVFSDSNTAASPQRFYRAVPRP